MTATARLMIFFFRIQHYSFVFRTKARRRRFTDKVAWKTGSKAMVGSDSHRIKKVSQFLITPRVSYP